jgi:hypothetical protein
VNVKRVKKSFASIADRHRFASRPSGRLVVWSSVDRQSSIIDRDHRMIECRWHGRVVAQWRHRVEAAAHSQ